MELIELSLCVIIPIDIVGLSLAKHYGSGVSAVVATVVFAFGPLVCTLADYVRWRRRCASDSRPGSLAQELAQLRDAVRDCEEHRMKIENTVAECNRDTDARDAANNALETLVAKRQRLRGRIVGIELEQLANQLAGLRYLTEPEAEREVAEIARQAREMLERCPVNQEELRATLARIIESEEPLRQEITRRRLTNLVSNISPAAEAMERAIETAAPTVELPETTDSLGQIRLEAESARLALERRSAARLRHY